MSRASYILVSFINVAFLSACSTNEATTERTKVAGGIEYSIPANEAELPQIDLLPIEDGLSLASCATKDRNCIKAEDLKLWETLKKAGDKIREGVYTDPNVFAAGVAWGNFNFKTVTRCVKVQVQHRKNGKLIVDETFVPEGQGEECKVESIKGLTFATMAIFARVYGNNYGAGIGVGAVLYTEPYIVGCAAGVLGYASQTLGTAAGTAGAFCTQIYDTKTLVVR